MKMPCFRDHRESGKSHLAQALGQAAMQQGYRVLYRETHALLDELADAALDGKRREHMEFLSSVSLLILDDFGVRKLSLTAAELLELIMRRYERASTLLTSNRRTGANSWVTLPPSRPCSIAFSTVDLCLTGAPKLENETGRPLQ
jgi:chromosomal replication initiation ATPase DnaA